MFEIAAAIPVSNSLVVLFDLPAAGGDKVFDKILSQVFFGKLALLQQVGAAERLRASGRI